MYCFLNIYFDDCSIHTCTKLTVKSGQGSIFSRQFKKQKKEEFPMDVDSIPITENSVSIKEKTENYSLETVKHLPSESYVVTGSDSKQIHEENVNLMKTMSEKEILEEREKLIATMDPAILSYLKSRRKKEKVETRNPTIKEQNEIAENIDIADIETPSDVLAQPKAEKWLNFDVIETNKLAWMKNIDIPKLKKSEQFEARFDFEGWLMPYSENDINEKNRILYHHGDEPGRPGYTLQELFQLSRSSVIQQKILALNSIANILSLNSTGVYDEILDIPIEQMFFVIRFCLDDNTSAVLNAGIKAMRNLIYSQVDETCLDSLLGFGLGFVQPIIAVDNAMEDDYTVNDQQLAEKNIVRCLARTEILTRIRYIINTVKPPLETIVYCLDILIRLARDSEFVLMKIFNCEDLMNSITKNFVPEVTKKSSATSAYGLPILQAVKLLRIISSRSKTLASKLISRYKVLDSITLYLSNDTFSSNVNGLRLQTECLNFWSVLLHYGLALDYFSVFQPVLLHLLDYHFKNTNLEMEMTYVRQGHIAALLILLSKVVEKNYSLASPFLPVLIEKCIPKWCNQFAKLEKFVCGKLQLIASLVYCMSSIQQYQQSTVIDGFIKQMIESQGFNRITDNIRSGSMLLNNYETLKCSSNLKTLEAAAWHTMEHVVPIIQTNSCLPYLYAVSVYVNVTNDKQVKLSFLRHTNIQKYLASLQKLEKYYLTNNWFARPESILLMNILKSSVPVKENLDTSIFYELAVKCLSVFTSDQKPDIEFLLRNIVFCSKFYPSDVLLEHLDISQRSVNLEISLSNLSEILEVYTLVLGLNNDVPDLSSTCCLDISIGNVIPIDWIYTPILVLYSNEIKNKDNAEEAQQIFTIRNCLRWILIYETYFPFLASTINPTDKFCRLACVFLGSDSLFLTKEIHELLELCFKNIITKCERELNFTKEIQGLSNFQDLYTQLLEQYQGVSYGDSLFGIVILVPLAQRHNVQLRKTLWSEYMGAVQIFNVSSEQYFGDINLFLDPIEEDMSLLKCYRRAIINNTVRKHTVLFDIANHHVQKFMLKRKENK
ncbi:RNA polymerase II-associated protein 1 isoform X2 [Leptinotarsa decemlineata]|uniref:RNA polymerase II-associated protein 1 isoform X2 n=1 Tax=Leptinotarsa decemlineata TaxID=7539 RepID=UPI000C251A14|nr:RNA polymerase II-associated protein 1 isoform X2 [Leptinotarsa decemlineata]